MGEMLLTTGEVARYLRVSINTVHRLADSGDLPSSKVGRLRRFRPADVKAYVERADGATGPKPLRAASL